jgi:hypothetical protein
MRRSRRTHLLGGALLAGLICLGPVARGDETSPAQAARRDATAMTQAFLKGDLDTFANYTDPTMIKAAGSKQQLIEFLKKGIAQMKSEGARFVWSSVEAPRDIIKAGSELQALLPQKQILELLEKKGELHSTGHLLGISRDGGKTWTFLDASSAPAEELRKIVPTLSTKLKLPGRQEPPTFVPKAKAGSR